MSRFAKFDVALVRHLSGSSREIPAPEYLIERLGNANTKRRQLLEYYERHHEKIAAPDPLLEFDPTPEPERSETPGHIQETNSEQDLTPSGIITWDPGNVALSPSAAEKHTTVTTIYETYRDAADARSVTDRTETSYAPTESTAGGAHEDFRIHVPKIPDQEKADNGEPFQCPYCFTIIVVTGRISWM
jgi:hypothetical protein